MSKTVAPYIFFEFGIVFGQRGFAIKAIPCGTFTRAVELARKADEWQILKRSRGTYRPLPMNEDTLLWKLLEAVSK